METGFYYEMSETDYRQSEGVSKSSLDAIAPENGGSPAHYKAAIEHPMQPTPAMMLGTALHCAILEPSRFAEQYVNTGAPDKRSKAYKDAAEAIGERALTAKDADWLDGMRSAIWERSDANARAAQKLLTLEGNTEVSAYALHEPTGLLMRCRYDLLTAPTDRGVFAADVKKTKDASPREFAKSVWRYRYHVQAAYYSDIYYTITGEKLASYTIIAIEEAPPHAVQVYAISDEDMAIGRDLYRRDLGLLKRCLDADDWPLVPEGAPSAYNAAPSVLSLEPWMRERTESFLTTEDE